MKTCRICGVVLEGSQARYARCRECRAGSPGRPQLHPPSNGQKQCSSCGRMLPLERFAQRSAVEPTPRSRCKDCTSKETLARHPRRAEIDAQRVERELFAQRGLKRCNDCTEIKPFEEYYASSDRVDAYCKACAYVRHNRYLKSPKGKDVRSRSEFAGKLRRYGITPEEYLALVEDAGGVCWICRRPPKTGAPRLGVDHDHRTGMTRGVLCSSCNFLLGKLHEDELWFKRASMYLAEPPAIRVIGERYIPDAPPHLPATIR